jgi:formylglycine-generating enzyme required for sulfatase activity
VCIAAAVFGIPYVIDLIEEDPTETPTATLTSIPSDTATEIGAPTDTLTPSPSPLPTDTPTSEFSDDSGVEMILVPAGAFEMGAISGAPDEQPPHMVTLADYYLDKYEVTNALYAECVAANACMTPLDTSSATRPAYYGAPEFDEYPVLHVNWEMAKAYCEWRGGRLPTEAEWEKAARGDDGRMFPWGNTPGEFGNFCEEGGACPGDTLQVGSYPDGASPLGFLDMAGNVWEWVLDWYDPAYFASSPTENPLGPESGDLRVIRGGSWNGGVLQLRTTTRGRNLPSQGYNYVGFRCARSP